MGQLSGDIHVEGALSAGQFYPPSASIGGTAMKPRSAGDVPDASKFDHAHRQIYRNGAGKSTTTAVSETEVVHVAKAPGNVKAFRAGAVGPATGNATVTVDLRKNGVTILTAVITLDSTQIARQLVSAGVNLPTYALNDVFEIVTVATIGTGALPTGVFAMLDVYEGAEV